MTSTMHSSMNGRFIGLAVACVLGATLTGCETGRQTGALGGGGLGALLGGAFGGWEGAAIGTAVGAGAGYIIGNEMDIAKAKQYGSVPATELVPFSGSKWTLAEFSSSEDIQYKSATLEFRPDGILVTTKTDSEGLNTVSQEKYRVVGEILIVNKPGYVMNIHYQFSGDMLYLSDQDSDKRASFRRTG